MVFWSVIAIALLGLPFYYLLRFPRGLPGILKHFSTQITMGLGLTGAVFFVRYLFGVTPIVLFARMLRASAVTQALSSAARSDKEGPTITFEPNVEDSSSSLNFGKTRNGDAKTEKAVLQEGEGGWTAAPPVPLEDTSTTEPSISAPLRYLVALSGNSEGIAAAALRRANIHLFAGVMIGIIGMVFFFVSTASDEWSKGFFSILSNTADKEAVARLSEAFKTVSVGQMMLLSIAHSLPRITVLVFVEVLAGFFLKQYRTAMEEFRYYEEISRERQGVVAAFMISQQFSTQKQLLGISKHLLNPLSVGILKHGQTTATLQSAADSQNEFLKVFQEMRGVVKDLAAYKKDSLKAAKDKGAI